MTDSPTASSGGEAAPPDRTSFPWIPLAKITIGVGLLAALFGTGRVDLTKLAEVRHEWRLLLLAQAFFLCALLLTFYRWKLLLDALRVPAPWRDVNRLGWIGLAFSQVMPGATGGDVVKAFYIARDRKGRRTEALLSVFLDRVIGLTGLMILGAVAIATHFEAIRSVEFLESLMWGLVVALVLVLGGGTLLSWEGLWRQGWIARIAGILPGQAVLGRVGAGLWSLRGKRRILAATLGVSVLSHSLMVAMNICLGEALLGEDCPSWGLFFFLIPMGQLAAALPISPAGIGVGEWAYGRLFESLGQPSGEEIMLLVRLSWILWAGVGVAFYLQGKKEIDELRRIAEEEGDEGSPRVESTPAPRP